MIKVSQQAMKVLLQALKESGASPDKALRLTVKDGDYALDLDTPRDDDQVLRYFDSVLLLVDPSVEKALGNALIDVELGPDEARLTIRRLTQESTVGPLGETQVHPL